MKQIIISFVQDKNRYDDTKSEIVELGKVKVSDDAPLECFDLNEMRENHIFMDDIESDSENDL